MAFKERRHAPAGAGARADKASRSSGERELEPGKRRRTQGGPSRASKQPGASPGRQLGHRGGTFRGTALGVVFGLVALACPGESEERPRGQASGDNAQPATESEGKGASPAPDDDAPRAASDGEPMNETLELYVRRLESVGFELAPTAPEHDPESLGAYESVAFEIEEEGIYLELLLFEHQSEHSKAIAAVNRSGWGGEGYLSPASSGAVLLLARGPDQGTHADRARVNRLLSAFAGEE